MTTEELAKAFFRLRFSRDPDSDPGYYHEWVERFKKGPESYMDSESLAVWKVIKGACDLEPSF